METQEQTAINFQILSDMLNETLYSLEHCADQLKEAKDRLTFLSENKLSANLDSRLSKAIRKINLSENPLELQIADVRRAINYLAE